MSRARVITSRKGRAAHDRGGFTLLELLMVVTIIAMVAAFVMPLARDEDRVRVMAAATLIASDIELAQVMTIAHPDEPIMLRFKPDVATYWLAYAADPDTPIARPDTGDPYTVELGVGRASSVGGVTMVVHNMAADAMEFAEHGGLTEFSVTPIISLTHGSETIHLTVAPMTGTVSEAE